MAGLTDALENTIGDHLFSNGAYTPPTNVFCALSINGSSELAAQYGYARTQLAMGAASAAAIANNGACTFAACTGTQWGTVSHFAIYTLVSSGTQMTDWIAVDTSKLIDVGDVANWAIGALVINWLTGWTEAYATSILDKIFRNQTLTPAATTYVGVSINGSTELASQYGYVRPAAAWHAFDASGVTENTALISYPTNTAGGDWGHITHYAVFTAETSGTQMTAWKELSTHIDIAVGDTLKHAAGALTWTID